MKPLYIVIAAVLAAGIAGGAYVLNGGGNASAPVNNRPNVTAPVVHSAPQGNPAEDDAMKALKIR